MYISKQFHIHITVKNFFPRKISLFPTSTAPTMVFIISNSRLPPPWALWLLLLFPFLILLTQNLNQVTHLLKTCQSLPISLRVKEQFLLRVSESLQDRSKQKLQDFFWPKLARNSVTSASFIHCKRVSKTSPDSRVSDSAQFQLRWRNDQRWQRGWQSAKGSVKKYYASFIFVSLYLFCMLSASF